MIGLPAGEIDLEVLDDAARLQDADVSGMLMALATGGSQIRRTLTAVAGTDLSRVSQPFRPRAVVVAGLGVAGLAGDALEAVVGSTSPVIVGTHRHPGVPGWLGAADAVVAVSASGASEVTLGALAEAIRRDAAVVGVGPADSAMREMCERARAPFVPVDLTGGPSRTALWALVTAVLTVTRRAWELHRVSDADLHHAADRLDEVAVQCRPASETFVNPAKTAVATLARTIPVLVGTSPLAGVAAHRFATQLAVSARWPATWGVLPESARHLVAVLEGPFARAPGAGPAGRGLFHDPYLDPEDATAVRLRLVLLRDSVEAPSVSVRADDLVRSAADRGVEVTELTATGVDPVERLASLVAPTDFASVYLALAAGIDPTPVRIRDEADRGLLG